MSLYTIGAVPQRLCAKFVCTLQYYDQKSERYDIMVGGEGIAASFPSPERLRRGLRPSPGGGGFVAPKRDESPSSIGERRRCRLIGEAEHPHETQRGAPAMILGADALAWQ